MNEDKELFLPDTTVKLGTLRRVLNDTYGLDIIKLKMATNTEIASTIVNQLGGMGRLNMMTGAYNFGALPNGVTFRIKNQRANVIKITLTSMDLYNLEVGRLRGGKYTIVTENLGLYNDMLKPAIEKATGMYLSLFAKGGGVGSEIAQMGTTVITKEYIDRFDMLSSAYNMSDINYYMFRGELKRPIEEVERNIARAKEEIEVVNKRLPFTTWELKLKKGQNKFEFMGDVYEIYTEKRPMESYGWRNRGWEKAYYGIRKITNNSEKDYFTQLPYHEKKEELISMLNWKFIKSIYERGEIDYPLPEKDSFQDGGTINSVREFTQEDFDKLMESGLFRAHRSVVLLNIYPTNGSKLVGKFNSDKEYIYISGKKDLSNPLVEWLSENSYVTSDEYRSLANGGGVGKLKVGDIVVGYKYDTLKNKYVKGLVKGEVLEITPNSARVKYFNPDGTTHTQKEHLNNLKKYADGGGVGGTFDSSSTGEVLGGTYGSSESGEMIGGTMASSMYKNGGGVGEDFSVWKLSKSGVVKLKTGTMTALNRFLNKEKSLQNKGLASIFDGKSGVVTFPSNVTQNEVIKYNNSMGNGSATSQEYANGGGVGDEISIATKYGKMLNEISKEKQFNKKIELNSQLNQFAKQNEISIDNNNIIYIKGNKVAYIDKLNSKTGQSKINWIIKKYANGGGVADDKKWSGFVRYRIEKWIPSKGYVAENFESKKYHTIAKDSYEAKNNIQDKFLNDTDYKDVMDYSRVVLDYANGGGIGEKENIVVKSLQIAEMIKKTMQESGSTNVQIKKGKKQFNPLLETSHWQEYIIEWDKKYANGGGIGGTSDSAEMDAPTLGGTMSSSMFEGDTYSNRFENKLWNEIADGTPHSFKYGGRAPKGSYTWAKHKSLMAKSLPYKYMLVDENGDRLEYSYGLKTMASVNSYLNFLTRENRGYMRTPRKIFLFDIEKNSVVDTYVWVDKTSASEGKNIGYFGLERTMAKGGNCGCKEKYDEGGNAECGCWHYDIGGL
jgi:hypothetical protein